MVFSIFGGHCRAPIRAIGQQLGFRCALGCLIPWFDGVIVSEEWKETLWDKFVMAAPIAVMKIDFFSALR
jgi:hypothetical protein